MKDLVLGLGSFLNQHFDKLLLTGLIVWYKAHGVEDKELTGALLVLITGVVKNAVQHIT